MRKYSLRVFLVFCARSRQPRDKISILNLLQLELYYTASFISLSHFFSNERLIYFVFVAIWTKVWRNVRTINPRMRSRTFVRIISLIFAAKLIRMDLTTPIGATQPRWLYYIYRYWFNRAINDPISIGINYLTGRNNRSPMEGAVWK